MFKILLLGDSGVGKTALINQYVNQTFNQNYRQTIGADFMVKSVLVNDRFANLQIWDTAGQERFQALGGSFYRGSDCCVLVYDITNKKSFENLESWIEEFKDQGRPENPETFPFVVIGNKSDQSSERKVDAQTLEQWCKSHGDIKHFEISAKENNNVEAAFIEIAKAAASQSQEEEIFSSKNVALEQDGTQKKINIPNCQC